MSAKVLRVAASGSVTIDAGSLSGLRKGMKLLHPEHHYLFRELVVDSVEEGEATIKTEHPQDDYHWIKPGDAVVSHLPDAP